MHDTYTQEHIKCQYVLQYLYTYVVHLRTIIFRIILLGKTLPQWT